MNITLRAKNCDVTSKIKEEARQKAEHATRFYDRVNELEICFAEESNPRIPNPATVEITARSKKHTVRAVGAADDHHGAIDQAVARFEKQLRRYKSRLVDRGRRGGRDEVRVTGELPEMPITNGSGADADEAEPTIVRRKTHELAAMFPEDAVMQLELLGHDFYLFTNAGTGAPNVIYRREAGDVGLIEGVPADVTKTASAAS